VGTVAAKLFALGVAVFTARLLGKEGYGELGMIQSTILFLGTFAGFALGVTTTKYVAELKTKDPARAGRIIAMTNTLAATSGVLLGAIGLMVAPWLVQKTINAPHLVTEMRLGAATLILSVILGVQTGTLSGLEAFKAIARINFYQGLVSLPVALALVYFWGLKGAVLSLAAPLALGVWMSSRTIVRECYSFGIRLDYFRSWAERRILWNFSLPAFLASSMVTPVTWAANAFLVNQPNGYAEMGLFNAANQFRMLILFLPNIIGMVTLPLLSEIQGQNIPAYFAQAVNINLRTIWGVSLPLGFLLVAFSPILITLYGPKFQGGGTILALMVCVGIMFVAGSTIGQVLVGSGKMWTGFSMNLVWTVIFVPLVAYLVPSHGALGLAVSSFLAYSLFTICLLIYIGLKFGREGVQHSITLSAFTGILFLMALWGEHLSGRYMVSLTIIFMIATGLWSWRILPYQFKQKVMEIGPVYFIKLRYAKNIFLKRW
jgi:O-antigen/teichoic acid export membrane protein